MNLRRKRMMLMDGQWYGYLRTASGNPLTLQAAKRLRKLTIYGNAVQDGTPSPDAPVEVQLCGDRTGNLLDVTRISGNQIEVTDNKVYLSGYACAVDLSPEYFLEMTGLSIGDTITCSNSVEVISGTANAILGRVAFITKNKTTSLILCSNNTRTVTIPSDFNNDNYTNLLLYGAVTPDESDERLAVMSNLAIYKGSYTADTLPAYEPYGYKVSGRVEGVNLFTADESKWQIQTYKYFKIPVDGTTTLQMKLKPGKSIPSTLYVGYTNTGYPSDTGISWLIENGAYINSGVNMMSDSKGYISMYPPYLFDEMLDAFDIMLVQGAYTAETMPPYEPYQPPQDFAVYLPEQIAKVGDVADEVVVDMERKTAELKKNTRRLDFTGEEIWGREASGTKWSRYNSNFNLGFQLTRKPVISNRFSAYDASSGSGHYDLMIFAYSSNIYIYYFDKDTVSDFKQFLATNPTYAYVEDTSPVTTDITSLQQWDAMPQVSGTVTLTLSAEVDPSGAEAVYYSKERGE